MRKEREEAKLCHLHEEKMKNWEEDGVLQSKVEENSGHLNYRKNI